MSERLRDEFLRLLTQDGGGNDMRRKDFNQAIFDPEKGWAVFNGTDLWMVMAKFDKAVQNIRGKEGNRINSMLVVDYVREQYERGAADKAAELQDYYGEQAQGHYMDGYKMGYARGLIEGDHGGRREGYRSGYAAGKDAVMTDSYAQAVAEGQRDEREKWSVLIKDRIRDLQSCAKHDDCMGKADILLVILDDYDYGVAREEKS